jgi:E1A/CREB-binding protein
MSVIFTEAINPVMRRMGYCCGQKRTFTPLVQYCFGIVKNQEACVIARNQPYFLYERFIYCTKCFRAMPEKGINMAEESDDPPK